MKIYLAFFVASFATAWIVTPIVRTVGTRLGILDMPGVRKVHHREVPRLGGLAIAAAVILPFLGFLFYSDILLEHMLKSWQPLFGLALGCAIVFGIGVLDDIRGLPPLPKLLVEVLAGVVVYTFGLKVEFIGNPFGLPLDLSWLSGPITVLWLVMITNAINLADGIDGLATGIATLAAGTLFFMTFTTAHSVVALLAVALAGASFGFLWYNFPPATIFLGDSGSLFLGFLLGGLSIWASEKSAITFAILIPIVALGLPLVDMLYAVLRRWYRGIPVGQADREHIHHKLLDMGLSHRRVVLLLYGVNILLMALAGLMLVTRNSISAFVLIILGLALVGGLQVLGYLKFPRIFRDLIETWQTSRQAKYVAFQTRLISRAFEKETTLIGRWRLATELFGELGFSRASFTPAVEYYPELEWFDEANRHDVYGDEVLITIPLFGEKGLVGRFTISRRSDHRGFPPGINVVLNVMANAFTHRLSESEESLKIKKQTGG